MLEAVELEGNCFYVACKMLACLSLSSAARELYSEDSARIIRDIFYSIAPLQEWLKHIPVDKQADILEFLATLDEEAS